MSNRLEHANLHVNNVDATLRFILTAFEDFAVRHDSGTDDPERWIHVGTDSTYLALYQASQPTALSREPYAGTAGFNHLGFEVEDAEALQERMIAAGYTESTLPNHHPGRKRIYFRDPDGNEWEFVQYLSNENALRNDYSL